MDPANFSALEAPTKHNSQSVESARVGRKRSLSCTFATPRFGADSHGANHAVPVTEARDAPFSSQDEDDDNMALTDLLEPSKEPPHKEATESRVRRSNLDDLPLIDLVDSPPPSPRPDQMIPPSAVVDLCTPPSPTPASFLSTSQVARLPQCDEAASTTLSITTNDPYDDPAMVDPIQPPPPPRPRIPRTRKYPRQTSAYLQNLAEMCWTFLEDARWRTSCGHTLLRWEYGDDLKGIVALARQYIPPPPKVPVACPCLFCANHAAMPAGRKNGENLTPQPAVASPEKPAVLATKGACSDTDCIAETDDSLALKVAATEHTEYDEEDSRQLYLFSRLFYRKGPWFRVDDVFQRYYATKKPEQRASDGRAVHTELLDQQLQTVVPEFLEDLCGLVQGGMVRGFESESECGKTVDCSILTADERRATLQKLGGGSRKKQGEGSCSIWKQMTTQKSLFSATGMLPVIRHVDDILLDKFARQVVLSCSSEKEIPRQDMTVHLAAIKVQISKLHRQIFGGKSISHLCFRLSERPMHAIQRCARLFVCSTSGPGNMRGNGSNGWRSVLNVDNFSTVEQKKSVALAPPGKHAWHDIRYPGLEHRFGLRSAPFFHTYQHIQFAPASQSKADSVGVFSSVKEFRRWELCVEVRAFADYAIEFEDSVRYDQRRVAKGKEPLRGCELGNFIDTFALDSKEKRLVLLGGFFDGAAGCLRRLNESVTAQISNLGDHDCCSQALMSMGILITQILINDWDAPSKQQGSHDVLTARPWLRHLSWQCCLAYVLWDIIPIFERIGHYTVAIQALETVLFGTCDTVEVIQTGNVNIDVCRGWSPFLSRRARGKAIDRIAIDLSHVFRVQCSNLDKKAKKTENDKFQQRLVDFSRALIVNAAPLSSFGFSSIRTIARRLKRPLSQTLHSSILAIEAQELGLRLGPESLKSDKTNDDKSKYIDWQPITDISVANAVAGESDPGSRCSFIGHDDSMFPSSLNVEEYALEMYGSGRLPLLNDDEIGGGGWVGWHDEGSHLRALFRILCGAPILGAGYGCMSDSQSNAFFHISPYQESPFDLHVGFELTNNGNAEDMPRPSAGIFFRRSSTIHSYLGLLRRCDSKALANLVFDSIAARLEFATRNSMLDSSLEKDVLQIRTFSALAAGFGGKVLARAFQCMLYDYRHYSGGLPDLLLMRTVKRVDGALQNVDMDWIGESFSKERMQQEAGNRAMSILFDKDDEYLGCEKVGDFQVNSRSKRPPSIQTGKSAIPALEELPERLQLCCDGTSPEIQCLFVEVKSSNDRLDTRQEDWLNALSKEGLARVCKFEDSKKGKQKKTKEKAPTTD